MYTNNPPCGAMRGFGVNQTAFAIEGMLDRLADEVGIDGWEIRWRNALREGDRFATGQRLGPGIGLERTLLAVRDEDRAAPLAQGGALASGIPGAVLEVLLARVEKIVSKEAIIQAVANWGEELSLNAIEVYVSRLRAKLEPAGIRIRTVRGFGYILEEYKDP